MPKQCLSPIVYLVSQDYLPIIFPGTKGKAAALQLPRSFCLPFLKLGVAFAFFHFHFSGLSPSSLALLKTISAVSPWQQLLSALGHAFLQSSWTCVCVTCLNIPWPDSLLLRSEFFALEFHTGLRDLDSLSDKAKVKKTLSISAFFMSFITRFPIPFFLAFILLNPSDCSLFPLTRFSSWWALLFLTPSIPSHSDIPALFLYSKQVTYTRSHLLYTSFLHLAFVRNTSFIHTNPHWPTFDFMLGGTILEREGGNCWKSASWMSGYYVDTVYLRELQNTPTSYGGNSYSPQFFSTNLGDLIFMFPSTVPFVG